MRELAKKPIIQVTKETFILRDYEGIAIGKIKLAGDYCEWGLSIEESDIVISQKTLERWLEQLKLINTEIT